MSPELIVRDERGSRIAERAPDATALKASEIDLVKKTVAAGATDAELALYLHDCARQGVHPLDRLLHFTKRGGKYTPVTSIDLMRIRAAETNEYAGSDDAGFGYQDDGKALDFSSVTVHRLVQGTRCAFTATARWSEYYPGDASGTMWRKMPHTMLAKCAEALALRKGFPRQLAGLYAKEEMDQAERPNSYSVSPPAPVGAAIPPPSGERENRAGPDRGESGHSNLPAGAVFIERIDVTDTKNPNVKRALVTLSSGEQLSTIKTQLAALAEQCLQDRDPVFVESKQTKWGTDLVGLTRAKVPLPEIQVNGDIAQHSEPVDDSAVPF